MALNRPGVVGNVLLTQDLKESGLVADLVLTVNLLQTAEAAKEKEREAIKVEANSWCKR